MSEFLLKHPKGELNLPVREATENPSGIDVGNLLK
jgi:citrate synthase